MNIDIDARRELTEQELDAVSGGDFAQGLALFLRAIGYRLDCAVGRPQGSPCDPHWEPPR